MKFILPDFERIRKLNFLLFQERQKFPDFFDPSKEIISVYGTLYNTEADGGRCVQAPHSIKFVEAVVNDYLNYGVNYSHVLSNEFIDKDLFYSESLSKLLPIINQYNNNVVVSNLDFSQYIKKQYPNIKTIGSVVRLDVLQDSCIYLDQQIFDAVVINPKYNYYLDEIPIQYRDRIIVLANDCCPIDCPNKKECYIQTFAHNQKDKINRIGLGEYEVERIRPKHCSNILKTSRMENHDNPYDGHIALFRELNGVINPQDYDVFDLLGIQYVKIEGRRRYPMDLAFLYTDIFVKPEHKENILYNLLYYLQVGK